MKSKLIAFFVLSILYLNSTAFAAADVEPRRVADTAGMVALLPESDAVVVIDTERFISSALPQFLSANPSVLAEINKGIDEAKAQVGVDLRQFEYLAAGVTATKTGEKDYIFDTVMIARGQINAGGLLGMAKIAANGRYREEKIGDRAVYIFDMAEPTKQGQPGKVGGIERALGGKTEVAATTLDEGTIIVGSVDKVRLALSGTSRVSPELIGLMSRTTSPVVSFAGKVPGGMRSILPLDNDELGKQVDSIQYLYGSMDVNGVAATFNATARTEQPEAASGLKGSLDGLQMLGKALLGGAKGADKQVYARLVDSVKFSASGNEVSMDLSIAQADINFLIGLLTKKTASSPAKKAASGSAKKASASRTKRTVSRKK